MKNFEEKIIEKMSLCVVWLGENNREKIFMWGPDIFHPGLHKICLSKMEKILTGESLVVKWTKSNCPINFSYGSLGNVDSSFFIIFFILFYILNSWAWCFVFFFCLIRNDFFPRNDFLNKFGWFFFFQLLITFLF